MIKIFSLASNRPDFIALQLHSFRKYLKEDFEFVVFNNSKFSAGCDEFYDAIHEQGKQLGVSIIDIPKDQNLIDRCQAIELQVRLFNSDGRYSVANVAGAYPLAWAWENIISKGRGPIAYLDSDIFLIQPIKLTDSLNPHVICGIPDGRIHADGRCFRYIWSTFFLIDMARLPDPETMVWWCGRIEGVPVDGGGQTYHYFQAHPDLDVGYIKQSHYCWLEESEWKSLDFQPPNYDEFYLNDVTILHYRSGSNWDGKTKEYHAKKTEWLKRRIEEGK